MSDEKPDLSRRGFLRGNMLTRDGREQQKKNTQPLGLSPPKLGLSQVAGQCVDCTQPCAASCPQKIIKLHPAEHALSAAPYLDFSRDGCTYCDACVEACPKVDASVDAELIGVLSIDHAKCFTWNSIFCMSCLGRCAEKALLLNVRRQLELLSEQCTGCGFCLRSCPANALAIQALS